MIKELLKLLDIQDLDLQIIESKKLQKKLPENLDSLEKDVVKKKKDLEAARDVSMNLKASQKNLETEAESNKQTIIKYQNQLLQIKNNVQYKALTKEIDTLEKKNAGLEDQILGLMVDIDQKDSYVKECGSNLKQSEQNLVEGKDQIKKDIERVDVEIAQLNEKRSQQKQDVNPKVMSIYERVMRHKQDTHAVVFLEGNICQGCYMTLTPNDVNEVHKCHKIITCENCSRILYWIPSE